MTPIGVTSSFPTLPPGPGVWRLTPPSFLAPQTPWLGNVRPFVLQSVDQFLPDPPPSLQSDEWVEAFQQIKTYGASIGSARTDEQTFIAKFWSANTIRQYNLVGRDITDARGLGLLETARLAAMVNLVAADAAMAGLHAKYHYLFWRPVTAINGSLDPTAVTNDGSVPCRVMTMVIRLPSSGRAGGRSSLRLTIRNIPPRMDLSRRRWPRCSAPSSEQMKSTSIFTGSTPPDLPGP